MTFTPKPICGQFNSQLVEIQWSNKITCEKGVFFEFLNKVIFEKFKHVIEFLSNDLSNFVFSGFR